MVTEFIHAILRVYNYLWTSYRHGRTSTGVSKTLSTDLENLHKVLAHAPDIISSFNNGLGLEQLSEGLEASNKLIRRYRERLSRKFSLEDNMKDVFTRFLCGSDALLLLNRKVNKSVPQASLLIENISDQEILVNSLILPEDD